MSRAVLQRALEAQERMKLSRDYARLPGYPLSDADRQMEKSTADLREALAQSEQPAPGYCKRCKDYTIEEPLFEQPIQPKQQKRVWIEISEQEMPEMLRSNWQFIAGIVWAKGKLKEKNS